MASSHPRKGSTPAKLPYSAKKATLKRNTSILNFFQKSDAPTSRQPRITQFATKSGRNDKNIGVSHSGKGRGDAGESLFLEDSDDRASPVDVETPLGDVDNENEDGIIGGKRRSSNVYSDLDSESELGFLRTDENGTPKRRKGNDSQSEEDEKKKKKPAVPRQNGPFIDESDEEDFEALRDAHDIPAIETAERTQQPAIPVPVPSLVREATSHVEDDELADFDEIEENEFREEEFLEPLVDGHEGGEEETAVNGCPVCQTSLAGLNETDVSVHVNNCLDCAPGPVSKEESKSTAKGLCRSELAAIPRPAQRDPFTSNTPKTSAFSRLMAGNAEDRAWATAAANDVASRGKQAYQRTCPFYKIIPGFSICVDAFRYGAIEGCNAYFLSHFHSDHYIGLTASWRHGPIYCSKVTGNLVRQQLKVDPKWVVDLEFEKTIEVPDTGGAKVTLIEANHCPGSALFLFEKTVGPKFQRVLHCGDFRASPAHVQHPLLRPETFDPVTGQRRYQKIDVCYLDTTYLTPRYSFPSQNDVVQACVDLCVGLNEDDQAPWERDGMMNKFLSTVTGAGNQAEQRHGRLLVVIGTYSIGKERICLAIARALGCKIYATAAKKRVCDCLEDPELSSLLTGDPLEAQIHMQTMFEIRTETLADYLDTMKPRFSRVVGFRPTGWTYRPPAGRVADNPNMSTVLYSDHWRTRFSARDLVPQRGSTRESACFGVPYSEHSSFRELSMFCCALRIGRVIPTVNVGSQKSREKMKAWIEKWEGERRKTGEYRWAHD